MKLPTTDWQTGTQERVRRNEWRECEREWVGQERRRAGSCGATLEEGGPGAGESVRRDGGSRRVGAPVFSPLLLQVFSCP